MGVGLKGGDVGVVDGIVGVRGEVGKRLWVK